MERLTVNDLNKVGYDPWELCGMDSYCTKGCHEEGGCTKGCEILKMYRKLAEYEDLGERLHAAYGECDGLLEKVIEHLERHENVDIPEPVFKARLLTDGEVDRWEEYKTLDKQEKLLKLPCAVGDTAWIVFEGEIFKCMVSKFDIVRNGIFPMLRINETLETISVSMKTLEKTWFLTKESAESALKK